MNPSNDSDQIQGSDFALRNTPRKPFCLADFRNRSPQDNNFFYMQYLCHFFFDVKVCCNDIYAQGIYKILLV